MSNTPKKTPARFPTLSMSGFVELRLLHHPHAHFIERRNGAPIRLAA